MTRRELLRAALAAPVLAGCGGDRREPLPSERFPWTVGEVNDLPSVDTWVEREYEITPGLEEVKGQVFVRLDTRTESVRALRPHCTCKPGERCPVRWADGTQRFVCPCHGGIYGPRGNVLGGPPARPLTRLAVRVRDGTIYLGPVEG